MNEEKSDSVNLREALAERITAYLASGGLFNPEMATHDAVRDLLIDCRACLASPPAPQVAPAARCPVCFATVRCQHGFGAPPVTTEFTTTSNPTESSAQAVQRAAGPFMVFDVESIGLHGEGFAVAYVVVDSKGNRLDEATIACDPASARGTDESRLWVAENIPPLPLDHRNPEHVRAKFWDAWLRWKSKGAELVADCCWPVEARFLAACVDDYHEGREWDGPYPLHDLASVLLACRVDPLAITERQDDEKPAHHPLMDARQSARQLIDALTETQRSSHTDGSDEKKDQGVSP